MRQRIRALSILVGVALLVTTVGTSLVSAQSNTGAVTGVVNASSQETSDNGKSSGNTDRDGDGDTGTDTGTAMESTTSDCSDIKIRIDELNKKIAATTDEDTIKQLKEDLETLNKKLEECLKPSSEDEATDESVVAEPDKTGTEEMARPCIDIKKKIADLDAKLAEGKTEPEEAARIKADLEVLRKNLRECLDKPAVKEAIREMVVEKIEDRIARCGACVNENKVLNEAKNAVNKRWADLKQIRATIKKMMEKLKANEGDEALKKEIDELRLKAQVIYEEWKKLNKRVEKAEKKLRECMATVKGNCPDDVVGPRLREGIKKAVVHDVIREMAPIALIVRWGNLEQPKPGQEPTEWEIRAKIDDGNVEIRRPVLFEEEDQVIDEGMAHAIVAKSIINGHWDGLSIDVLPGENATEFVLHVGDFDRIYRITDLYNINERHQLKNGMEVEIYNINFGGEHLKIDKYVNLQYRRSKALIKLLGIEIKIRDMVSEGKYEDKAITKYNLLRYDLANYLIPEGGETDIDDLLEKCKNALADSISEAGVDSCIAMMKELREKQKKIKVEQGLLPFPDVDDNEWFVDYVRFVKENGLAGGFRDGTFGPGRNATRAELLKMAMEAAGYEVEDVDGESTDTNKGHWADKYIVHALKLGLVKGFDDGFRPDDPVTRAEAMKIILNVLGIEVPQCEEGDFPDTVNHWAKCVVKHGKDLGIVSGNPDGNFAPNTPITRAAIAKILKKAVEYLRMTEAVATGETVEGSITENEIDAVEADIYEPVVTEEEVVTTQETEEEAGGTQETEGATGGTQETEGATGGTQETEGATGGTQETEGATGGTQETTTQ